MKLKATFILLASLWFSTLQAQDILGDWKTIKKETGEARSIVNIYQENGKIHGKVTRILDETKRDKRCKKCKGKEKNKKIEGLVLLKNFKKEGNKYVDGTIINPSNGKIYNSKLWIDKENPNILNVRGYLGFFYKTVRWKRAN